VTHAPHDGHGIEPAYGRQRETGTAAKANTSMADRCRPGWSSSWMNGIIGGTVTRRSSSEPQQKEGQSDNKILIFSRGSWVRGFNLSDAI
jgi:hypothetical protein